MDDTNPGGTLLNIPARRINPSSCGRHGQAFMQMLMQLSRQAQSGFSRFPAPRTAAMDLDLVPIVHFCGVTTTAGRLPWKILPVTQHLPSIHMQRALSSNTQAWSAIDFIEVWVFFTYNGTATPLAI